MLAILLSKCYMTDMVQFWTLGNMEVKKTTTTTTTYQLALFIFAFQISAFDATPNHILGGNKLQRFNAFFLQITQVHSFI